MKGLHCRQRVWIIGLLFLASCSPDPSVEHQLDTTDPEHLHAAMQHLSDVIVHDIFSPPVASRIYAYASISAYEVLRQENQACKSLAGQLNGLEPFPAPKQEVEYNYPLAGTRALLQVGKALTFSEPLMETYQEEMEKKWKASGIPRAVFNRSIDYGDEVAKHILAWANKDMYKETRTYPKYTISNDPARWQPTPPDYMDGIEPHWREIRPFVLDSAQQFKPELPTPFDLDPESLFFQEVEEVYFALEAEDRKEREAIAKFWDCNPYVSHQTGHVMYATKKITPGGHWIGIAKLAAQKAEVDFLQSAETYALTSIALADGFISCWDEKYRSNLIRPETVINQYIDEEWRPLLQTPPFPEYTSGHSVISRAAAVALTSLYGDPFYFEDTTEEPYGLPMRKFNSFLEASEEAAISRLYGGIHYMPAIENGVAQGEKVGELVVERLRLCPERISQSNQ